MLPRRVLFFGIPSRPECVWGVRSEIWPISGMFGCRDAEEVGSGRIFNAVSAFRLSKVDLIITIASRAGSLGCPVSRGPLLAFGAAAPTSGHDPPARSRAQATTGTATANRLTTEGLSLRIATVYPRSRRSNRRSDEAKRRLMTAPYMLTGVQVLHVLPNSRSPVLAQSVAELHAQADRFHARLEALPTP